MFFASPDRLYWLLALLPMLAAAGGYLYWQRRVRSSIGRPELVEAMSESRSRPLRWVRMGLVLVAAGLLVLAYAEPKWGRTAETVEREGVDLVYALDLSKSMLARDVAPTRLEASTGEMKETLARLDGDRVGLVVYTTVSFVQSPLTTDYGALRFYLDKLDPSQMSVGGTAIGEAIRDSTELLTGEALGDSDSRASRNAAERRADTQVVVLMSDGEDHETDPVEAAKQARERGIRVVTVGVGSESGAKIPVRGEDGTVKGYKRNDRGNPVETALEENQLRKIAEAGGGTYISYRGNGSVADALTSFVGQLEATKLESKIARQYRDRYLWFAIPALVLLLASILLGERRRGRLGWSTSSAGLLLVAAALGGSGCEEAFRSEHELVREGNAHLESAEYSKALEAYDRAESELGDSPPALSYDRGRAHLGAENYEEARTAFGRALGSGDPALRIDAHIGVGTSFARREEWERALRAYRRALQVYGRHPEAAPDESVTIARHNLEIAFRRLYPPCSAQEDELEENDTPSDAARLEKKRHKNLTLCGLDDDWFAVSAPPGSTVTVEAEFDILGEKSDPHHEFLPNSEDLRMELFGAAGETELAADRGDSGERPPQEGPVGRAIQGFEVGDETPVGRNGQLLVRLSAADELKFSYDLSVSVDPPCRALEEDSEDNDRRSEAAEIGSGRHRMQLCPDDPDWFQTRLQRGNSLFVDVRPTRKKGGSGGGSDRTTADDLEVEVVDAETGEPLGDARREGPFWTAGIQGSRRDRTIAVGLRGAGDDPVDTGYRLDVYNYQPCMAGDDRYEENDSLRDASTLEATSRHYRYLRICPGDEDFYEVQPKPAKSASAGGKNPTGTGDQPLRIGLQKVPPAADVDPDVEFDALDPETGEVLAEGTSTAALGEGSNSADESARGDDEPRFDRVVRTEPPDENSPVGARVTGDATFYHLARLPEGDGNRSDRSRNRQSQSDQNRKNDGGDSRDDQREDSEGSDDRQNRERRQSQNKSPSESREPQSDAPEKKSERKAAREARARDILESLRNADENFQMQKALEKNRQKGAVEKDW